MNWHDQEAARAVAVRIRERLDAYRNSSADWESFVGSIAEEFGEAVAAAVAATREFCLWEEGLR